MPLKVTAKKIYRKIRVTLRDIYWDAQGFRIPVPQGIRLTGSVLFLCKGNICRSPFAEMYARRISNEEINFMSAGIEVTHTNPPPQFAVQAALAFDVSMQGHRSQPLTRRMMERADTIFVMDFAQFLWLKKRYPHKAGKIFPLALCQRSDNAPSGGYEKYNIADPYGRSLSEFIRCYKRIVSCIEAMLMP